MNKFWKYIVRLIGMFLFITMTSLPGAFAQAPNCEICDDVIGDPEEWALCMEENCNADIPIDTHIWAIMLGGIIIVFLYYKKVNSLAKN